jgi:hypothetical protein
MHNDINYFFAFLKPLHQWNPKRNYFFKFNQNHHDKRIITKESKNFYILTY